MLPSALLSFLTVISSVDLSQAQSTGTGNLQKTGVAPTLGGSSASRTIMPDLFTGTLTHAIPIEVPPGRHGLAPALALMYSSRNGRGPAGWGWDLPIDAIERQTDTGLNYDGDEYILRLGGSTVELINDVGNEYRAKIGMPAIRIRRLTATDGRPYWEVTDQAGTRSRFGQTIASRQDAPSDSSRIFRWVVDQVEDTNGNVMTFVYDEPSVYSTHVRLRQVDYPPSYHVSFYYEPDLTSFYSYPTDFRVWNEDRLKTITVTSGSFFSQRLIRAYTLTYAPSGSEDNGRTILQSVQQFGRDAAVNLSSGQVTGGTGFPPTTLEWTAPTLGPGLEFDVATKQAATNSSFAWWQDVDGNGFSDFVYLDSSRTVHLLPTQRIASWVETTHGTLEYDVATSEWVGATLTDLTGDGLADLVYQRTGTNEFRIRPAQGGSFGSEQVWGTKAFGADLNRVWFADVNGDSRNDLVYARSNSLEMRLLISNGLTAAGDTLGGARSYAYETEVVSFPGVAMADINGDGRADVVYQRDSTNSFYVMLSVGSSFGSDSPWSTTLSIVDAVWVVDMNGDRRADLVYRDVGRRSVQVMVSDGRVAATSFAWAAPAYAAQGTGWPGITFVDLNGDELLDVVYQRAGTNEIRVMLSHGRTCCTGLLEAGPEQVWTTLNDAQTPSHGLWLADINGDGRNDVIYQPATTEVLRAVNTAAGGPGQLVVTGVRSGLGAKTTIWWEATTRANSNPDGNPQLLVPIYTPTVIETCDNYTTTCVGTFSRVDIAYRGGFYYVPERDFRGFNRVTVMGQAGVNGETAWTTTYFHQGNDTDVDVNNPDVPEGYMKGNPYRTVTSGSISDGSSFTLYSQSTVSYTADSTAPYFTPPLQENAWICDGDACGKQTRTTYTYDAYGNVTREDQEGDVGTTEDDRTVVRTFVPNTTEWIVGLPASETTFQGLGTASRLSEGTFYYDDLTTCGGTPTNNQRPIRGNLTRVVRWFDGGTNPETQMAYDGYGNLVCTRDARGNTTTLSYDSTATFPVRVTNAAGHQTTTQYYGVDGVPVESYTYGQVKNVIDPNSATTTTQYDALGRMTCVDRSDGSWGTTAYVSVGGGVGTQHVRTDSAAGLSTWTYFDGLGRTYLERKTGPDSRLIAVQTQYDSRGAVRRTSLPYFEDTESPTGRWTTLSYDPVGRVVRRDFPDGTRALSCYNDWVSVGIDAGNHRKREVRDAFGRLVEVNEYSGTATSCLTTVDTPYATTRYRSDLLGNLRFVTDAMNNQTEMRYDTLGRKTFMHAPDMGDWSYQYDAAGNLDTQTDARGLSRSFEYDALNRVVTKTAPSRPPCGPLRFTATVSAQQTTVLLQHVLDLRDDVNTVRTRAGLGSLSWTAPAPEVQGPVRAQHVVDLRMNLDAALSALQLSRSAYTDESNATLPGTRVKAAHVNELRQQIQAACVEAPVVTVTYTYDTVPTGFTDQTYYQIGRLSQVEDSSGTTRFGYDQMGRIKRTDKLVDNSTYTTRTAFDLAGRVTTVTYPDNSTVSNEYNGPVLRRVYEGPTTYAQYGGYSALGQPASLTYGNGVVTNYSYARTGNATPGCTTNTFRLCTMITGTVQNMTYGYDVDGNVSNMTDTAALSPIGTQSFTYDALNRLITATGPFGTGGAQATLRYAYNEIGNMICNSKYTNSADAICDPASPSYAPNYTYPTGTNPVRPHAVTQAGTGVYGYDANGNMTSGPNSKTLTYDYENRPTSISVGGVTTTFVYAGDGGRVKKITGGLTTTYIGQLYECTTACNKYIFAGSQRIALKPVGGSTVNYYHTDHLGSTSLVTDQTGAVIERIGYYPFGQVRTPVTVDISHKFTGQRLDASTGLYFYNARYYDPALGRFIQADTVVPNPRDPQDLNRYSYVNNNPITYSDPTGHWKWRNFLSSLGSAVELVGGVVLMMASEVCPPCGIVGAALVADWTIRHGGNVHVNVDVTMTVTPGSGGSPTTVDITAGDPSGPRATLYRHQFGGRSSGMSNTAASRADDGAGALSVPGIGVPPQLVIADIIQGLEDSKYGKTYQGRAVIWQLKHILIMLENLGGDYGQYSQDQYGGEKEIKIDPNAAYRRVGSKDYRTYLMGIFVHEGAHAAYWNTTNRYIPSEMARCPSRFCRERTAYDAEYLFYIVTGVPEHAYRTWARWHTDEWIMDNDR